MMVRSTFTRSFVPAGSRGTLNSSYLSSCSDTITARIPVMELRDSFNGVPAAVTTASIGSGVAPFLRFFDVSPLIALARFTCILCRVIAPDLTPGIDEDFRAVLGGGELH